jgi:hypothetical protein
MLIHALTSNSWKFTRDILSIICSIRFSNEIFQKNILQRAFGKERRTAKTLFLLAPQWQDVTTALALGEVKRFCRHFLHHRWLCRNPGYDPSVQGGNTKIPIIPFRGNISDYSGFIYQLMGALAMQTKVFGIFLPKLPLKLFFLVFSITIRTFLCTDNCTNY